MRYKISYEIDIDCEVREAERYYYFSSGTWGDVYRFPKDATVEQLYKPLPLGTVAIQISKRGDEVIWVKNYDGWHYTWPNDVFLFEDSAKGDFRVENEENFRIIFTPGSDD